MQILGTKTGLGILKILVENPLQEFKEIELIKKAGTGKGSASDVINLLVKENILVENRIGRAKIVSLNVSNNYAFLIRELFDQEKLSNIDDRRLAALMLFSNEVRKFSDLVVVFGSSAAGTYHKESDIDILISSNCMDKVQESRKKIEELFNLRFNLHLYDGNDTFMQNAFLNGILLHGFDLGREIFSGMKIKDSLDRLFFFKERIKSALRNYSNKDYKSAEVIMESLIDQIILYLLSDKNIKYVSRKDAKESIKKIAEGRLIEKILKSRLKLKIDLTEDLVMYILTGKILKNGGY